MDCLGPFSSPLVLSSQANPCEGAQRANVLRCGVFRCVCWVVVFAVVVRMVVVGSLRYLLAVPVVAHRAGAWDVPDGFTVEECELCWYYT